MKKAFITIAICCVFAVVALLALGQKSGGSISAWEYETYTIFTWNKSSGDFCFKIMTTAQRNTFIHEWFPKTNAKCGAAELKKALGSLPKGSYVLWESWPPKNFDYPSEGVVNEILRFGEANAIHLELSPAVH